MVCACCLGLGQLGRSARRRNHLRHEVVSIEMHTQTVAPTMCFATSTAASPTPPAHHHIISYHIKPSFQRPRSTCCVQPRETFSPNTCKPAAPVIRTTSVGWRLARCRRPTCAAGSEMTQENTRAMWGENARTSAVCDRHRGRGVERDRGRQLEHRLLGHHALLGKSTALAACRYR
jgi:hypothetical protein